MDGPCVARAEICRPHAIPPEFRHFIANKKQTRETRKASVLYVAITVVQQRLCLDLALTSREETPGFVTGRPSRRRSCSV